MSIFSETMVKAIADYRLLLRRYLNQVDRMTKLRALNLKDPDLHESDIALYHAGEAIIADMEENMVTHVHGYYAYSGIQEFCNYLKEYLSNYFIENEQVVHRAQKASRALLESIQLTTLPREKLSDQIAKQLLQCNKTVVVMGSKEQCELQLEVLTRQQSQNPGFYTRIIAHLESMLYQQSAAV